MNEKLNALLLIYIGLPENEKAALLQMIEQYNRSPLTEKTKTFTNLNERRMTGPVASSRCVVCGK